MAGQILAISGPTGRSQVGDQFLDGTLGGPICGFAKRRLGCQGKSLALGSPIKRRQPEALDNTALSRGAAARRVSSPTGDCEAIATLAASKTALIKAGMPRPSASPEGLSLIGIPEGR